MRTRLALRFCAVLASFGWISSVQAQPAHATAQHIQMTAENWTLEPAISSMGDDAAEGKFRLYESMPSGTLTLNDGVAISRRARFNEGTIDFDMRPEGYDDAGLIFHSAGFTEGEFIYLRANPDCPAANDCIQYAPITHGMMAWNTYSNYQSSAPITTSGWNHVHIEVINGGMKVFINHEVNPSLVVPRLWGLSSSGNLGFKGPAVFANLTVCSSCVDHLTRIPAELVEAGTIQMWSAATPTTLHIGKAVTSHDVPDAGSFRTIAVEPSGLVDLGRAFGLANASEPSLAWLRTEVVADTPMRTSLRIGFAEEVSVFVNDNLVYTGENQYFPEAKRLSVDGRLEPDNAVINVGLRKGRNVIVLAVGNAWRSRKGDYAPSHYGWGASAHIQPMAGLSLLPPSSAP